jgi:lactoylglutathione lyase
MLEVDEKARALQLAGFPILRGPRKTGDGYYEFETLDPDRNRLEVCTVWRE